MKHRLSLSFAFVALTAFSPAIWAQNPTNSGTLTVTATVDPSISLTFNSDANGVALSAEDANAATLAFGHVKAYSYVAATGVTQSVNAVGASATSFSVSSPFGVLVMKANYTSSNYTLTAVLNSTDAVNSWFIDNIAVVSGTPAQITTTGGYGTAGAHTLKLTVPFSASSGAVSNAINFVATAN